MILPEPRDRFRGTLPKRWVALDFETTGIWKKDPDVAVIEIGLITYERDREVAAWSTLVKSDTPVSDFIAELTGITGRRQRHPFTFRLRVRSHALADKAAGGTSGSVV